MFDGEDCLSYILDKEPETGSQDKKAHALGLAFVAVAPPPPIVSNPTNAKQSVLHAEKYE